MIKLEFNGKPFNPKTFTETILKVAMENAAEQVREKVSSIRHPVTGEFPTIVVSGTSLDDISLKIEGSPELLELVNERLGLACSDAESGRDTEQANMLPPRVFLSYAWEDKALASEIANILQSNGIDTWWAEWCISAGDSLRQKIDEGLGDCTHFIVLLTPNSIGKPWVNQEMDAAIVRKLRSQASFIPLRYQLIPEDLPPLLSGMLSPSVEDPDRNINALINDIHGVTKKPALGPAPKVVAEKPSTGYSAAATAIAKEFVLGTKHARKFDPWIKIDELMISTGLSKEDVMDAVHELGSLVGDHHNATIYPENELFVIFDKYWKPWNPEKDALQLATDMLNSDDFPASPEKIDSMYGWGARRMNPAMAYLANRKLVSSTQLLNSGDWLLGRIQRTDATRRFVKSRAL